MAATEHKIQVGRRLRIAIEAVGKRPAEIARMFDGVTQPKLGNWMRGDDYPAEWFVVNFCDRFNITTDWIYRGRIAVSMDAALADALWIAEQKLPPAA